MSGQRINPNSTDGDSGQNTVQIMNGSDGLNAMDAMGGAGADMPDLPDMAQLPDAASPDNASLDAALLEAGLEAGLDAVPFVGLDHATVYWVFIGLAWIDNILK